MQVQPARPSPQDLSAQRKQGLALRLREIPQVQVTNAVCTVTVASTTRADVGDLNLYRMLQKAPVRYSSGPFPAVSVHLRSPPATVLVFRSGQMVVAGTERDADVRLSAERVLSLMRVVDASLYVARIERQNVVTSGACASPLDRCALRDALKGKEGLSTTFCPSKFPGIIVRPHPPGIVFLIFASGKFVVTGAKSARHAQEAWSSFYVQHLLPFLNLTVCGCQAGGYDARPLPVQRPLVQEVVAMMAALRNRKSKRLGDVR